MTIKYTGQFVYLRTARAELIAFDGHECVLVSTGKRGEYQIAYWAFCPVPGCKNRIYHNSVKCFPHTIGHVLEPLKKLFEKGNEECKDPLPPI